MYKQGVIIKRHYDSSSKNNVKIIIKYKCLNISSLRYKTNHKHIWQMKNWQNELKKGYSLLNGGEIVPNQVNFICNVHVIKG